MAAAIALSTAVADSVHSKASTASSAASATTSTSAPPRPPFDPASVTPTAARSLFRTANFARALGVMRARFGRNVDIEALRLTPGEAQFTIVRPGREESVGVRANGDYVTFLTRPLQGPTQAFVLSQVRPNVPAALARRIAAHGGVPVSQLAYMLILIDRTAHRFSWLVYRKGGDVHFQADGASSPITQYGSRGVRTLRG